MGLGSVHRLLRAAVVGLGLLAPFGGPRADAISDLDRAFTEAYRLGAAQALANLRAAVPVLSYPEELPVSQRRDDIAAALRDSQVVVVAGETGSGKTTQLPKILLELGRGVRGRIGHTQPRRIAARTVAERIADDLYADVQTF